MKVAALQTTAYLKWNPTQTPCEKFDEGLTVAEKDSAKEGRVVESTENDDVATLKVFTTMQR